MTVVNTNKPLIPNDGEFARTKGKVEAFGLTVYSPNGKALLDQAAVCDIKKGELLPILGAAAGADTGFWHARNICGDRDSTLKVVIAKLTELVAAQTQTNQLLQQQMMAAQVQAGVQAALAATPTPAQPVVPS
jgi:hypothetical protein